MRESEREEADTEEGAAAATAVAVAAVLTEQNEQYSICRHQRAWGRPMLHAREPVLFFNC